MRSTIPHSPNRHDQSSTRSALHLFAHSFLILCIDIIVNTAVVVLKNMVQAQLTSRRPATIGLSQSPLVIISQLARKIDGIRHPQARACVVWLVGQYAASEEGTPSRLEGVADWAPDVLRKMAKTFSQEVRSNGMSRIHC